MLRPSECRENLPFSFLSFSSSLSSFFFPSSRHSYPPNFFSLLCSCSLFIIFFFFFSFPHFSLFPFVWIFLFFFVYPPNSPSGEASSPPSYSHPHMPHVLSKIFLRFLEFFIFLLFPSFDPWLNVSHSHNYTTWIIPCVTPLGFHVAST